MMRRRKTGLRDKEQKDVKDSLSNVDSRIEWTSIVGAVLSSKHGRRAGEQHLYRKGQRERERG